MHDVIIVGGGPAGLSAALMLGRCCRRVLVLDSGRPRNARARRMNGFLTRDGIDPHEFLRLSRDELKRYPGVEFKTAEALDVSHNGNGFEVLVAGGGSYSGRKLLIATGVSDLLPPIDGIEELYGSSVFHCPYCDGWEVRNQPIAAYGQGPNGVGLALELLAWSADVALCTGAPASLSEGERDVLRRSRIPVREEKIGRLVGAGGSLQRIVFEAGPPLERTAFFFSSGQHQHSPLPSRLGCDFNPKGTVETGKFEATNVPGLYVAGDASREAQLVIRAAAEGAEAAIAINRELTLEHVRQVAPAF